MNKLKRWVCLALASLTLLSSAAIFTGCATGNDENSDGSKAPGAESSSEAETDRFQNVHFDGREYRIYTSINAASTGMGNSNFLIEGDPEAVGNMVNDAVMERNVTVEEKLDVKLVFIPCEASQMDVASDIQKYTQGGLNEFDIVINDIFGLSTLVVSGHFRNVLEEDCVFDFDQSYWYKDVMEDLRLINGYQYVLAGDFFADVLRSAHLLLLNKAIYQDYNHTSADELYDTVSNYEWTFDKLNQIITDTYTDKNLNNTVDKGDQFGLINGGSWGYFIPFSVCGNPPYIVRDEEGIPTFSLHEGDRSNQLATKMGTLIANDSTSLAFGDEDLLPAFTNGECLVACGQRLGSLENPILRQMENDAAVLPYPMLFAADKKYVTSFHDTTEMGFIPTTAQDMEFISTVTEVLNRETASIVLPKYYKESLQVQCVDDEKAAAMIDIIHDNFANAFILAYNSPLGNYVFEVFFTAANDKREFSVVYASRQKAIEKKLTTMIRSYKKHCNIE